MTDEMVPVGDDHGASPYAAERSSPVAPLATPQAKDAESDTDEMQPPIEERIQTAIQALGYDGPTALHITVAVMEQVAPWVVALIELASEEAARTVIEHYEEDV